MKHYKVKFLKLNNGTFQNVLYFECIKNTQKLKYEQNTAHAPTSGITTNEQGHFSLCRFTAEIKARRCTETAAGTWYTEQVKNV